MRLWFIGDAVFSPVMQRVAAALGATLTDASAPGATVEHARVIQIRALPVAPVATVHTVIYLDRPEYDAEIIAARALRRIADDSRVILVVCPSDAKAAEGLRPHWQGDRFITIGVDAIDDAEAPLIQALA